MSSRGAALLAPKPVGAGWAHHAFTLKAESFDASFDPDRLEIAIRAALDAAGLEAPATHVHRFEPQGFSFAAFGPALRVVLHTWPERGLASLDLHGPEEMSGGEALVAALQARTGWRVAERHDIERAAEGRQRAQS